MGQDTSGINAGWDWSHELTDDDAADAASAGPSWTLAQPSQLAFAWMASDHAAAQAAPVAAAAMPAAPAPTAVPVAAAAAVPAYPAMYVFGGSLCDVGNEFAEDGGTQPVAPNYAGTYSNGPLWIEDYAAYLNMPAPVANLLGTGGTDFAYAGAQTGAPYLGGTGFDLPEQYAEFTQQVPAPAPGALYVFDFGVNDLDAVIRSGADAAQMQAAVTQSVQTEVAYINALAARGATNFLVLNVPDFGTTPKELAAGPQQAAEATSLSVDYNTQLASLLVATAVSDHINLDLIDTFTLTDAIVADPAAFGFDNVTTPVWDGNDTNPNSGTLAASTPQGQDQYFFWDMMHPTAAGQAWIAAEAENLTFK